MLNIMRGLLAAQQHIQLADYNYRGVTAARTALMVAAQDERQVCLTGFAIQTRAINARNSTVQPQ